MVMGRKRKHSESTADMVAPSSDKSPSADCCDRSKGTSAADTSAPASNDIVCSSLQDQGSASGTEKVPLQRNAANERERARMRVLSKAFARLKTSLPWVPADTKLSKLDTLRLASCYIAHLSQLLAEDSEDLQTSSPVHGVGGGVGGGGGGGGGSIHSDSPLNCGGVGTCAPSSGSPAAVLSGYSAVSSPDCLPSHPATAPANDPTSSSTIHQSLQQQQQQQAHRPSLYPAGNMHVVQHTGPAMSSVRSLQLQYTQSN